MKPLNHIALVWPESQPAEDFLDRLNQAGFQNSLLSPGPDTLSALSREFFTALLLSDDLPEDMAESFLQHGKEKATFSPVLFVAEAPDKPPKISSALREKADGLLYLSMDAESLGIALRGIIRAGHTIRELISANRSLNEISITDALTRIYNRGYMVERLNLEFKRANRNRELLSCLMIDIDHFKQVNDTYGHKFGDVILVEFAKRLTAQIRETDVFGRYGGEEFLLILPNTNLEGAGFLGEKLRQTLEEKKFSYDVFSIQVTASFGVASTELHEVLSADHLLQISDRALYRAKGNGRNQVCLAGRDEESPTPQKKETPSAQKKVACFLEKDSQGNSTWQLPGENDLCQWHVHKDWQDFLLAAQRNKADFFIYHPQVDNEEDLEQCYERCKAFKEIRRAFYIPLLVVIPQKRDEAFREKLVTLGLADILMISLSEEDFLCRLRSLLHLKEKHDQWVDTYQELAQTRGKLVKAERLTALGEMAAGVAHDFNNILSAILGRAQILRRDLAGSPYAQNLEIIEEAAEQGAKTIRRIQDFSTATADREYAPMDLHRAIQNAIQITRTRWKDQADREGLHYHLRVECEKPLPVKGNLAELTEVVANLIFNALDAMPKGGQVDIDAGIEENWVILTVRDTGMGMDEETQKRIFDPFFSSRGEQRGTGLGLSVSYGIILRHNGQIECSSAPGEGATFLVRLPWEQSCELPQEAKQDGLEEHREKQALTILVVDDEAPIREIFREGLESEGHRVLLAAEGREALEIADENQIDVLFTDLGMPQMNGWQVSREMRRRFPQIVTILATGWGKDYNRVQLDENGVDHVLAKPVPFHQLLALARQLALGEKLKIS